MKRTPKSLLKPFTQIVYILAMPLFLLLSSLFYEPKNLCILLRTGEGITGIGNIFAFNLSIACAILILAITAMRMILLFVLRRKVSEKVRYFIFWCIIELLVASAFLALYFSLMGKYDGETYFYYLGACIKTIATILVFPYAFLTMYYWLHEAAEGTLIDGENTTKLRFYDSRHILKFVTQASSILYIKSDENYITIFYKENGTVKSYQLRSTMKDVEDMCLKNGMMKSHRSYMVNPSHVTLIRKDETGLYFAELDAGLDYGIPISKKYYQDLVSKL